MKRLGSRSWLLVFGALVIVLALGAVGCGGYIGESAIPAGEQRGAGCMQTPAERGGPLPPRAQAPAELRGEAMQDRQEARADRREALLNDLRGKMSEADQAQLDELTATIEEQRSTLEADRQELADTLKELRALTDKYLGPDGEQAAQ